MNFKTNNPFNVDAENIYTYKKGDNSYTYINIRVTDIVIGSGCIGHLGLYPP